MRGPEVTVDTLTSLELHLDHPAGAVVRCRELRDVGCGMYPCYYARSGEGILASTWVVAMLRHLGNWEPNKEFRPDYINREDPPAPTPLMTRIQRRLGLAGRPVLIRTNNRWYPGGETVDNRIYRLRAFQTLSADQDSADFHPDFTINDVDEYLARSVEALTHFVRHVEESYPDHQQVVLTGGKDSLLIHAVMKQRPDNWWAFSAEPNYPLVCKWMETNAIPVREVIRHAGEEGPDKEEFRNAVLASDLRANVIHFRWLKALKELAERLGGRCFFWSGTIGDAIFKYYAGYHGQGQSGYFRPHRERACLWQGTYHQAVKNFTGCPLISLYHHDAFWSTALGHLDPLIIQPGMDLRPRLAEMLTGRTICWPATNPAPPVLVYPPEWNQTDLYMAELESLFAP